MKKETFNPFADLDVEGFAERLGAGLERFAAGCTAARAYRVIAHPNYKHGKYSKVWIARFVGKMYYRDD